MLVRIIVSFFILFIFLSLGSCRTTFFSKRSLLTSADSIKIYNVFERYPYSTVGAEAQFLDLARNKCDKFLVEDKDKDVINKIMENATKRRHFQRKMGLYHYFLLFYQGGQENRVLVSYGTETITLTDLWQRIDYVTCNLRNANQLYNILTKLSGKSIVDEENIKLLKYENTNINNNTNN